MGSLLMFASRNADVAKDGVGEYDVFFSITNGFDRV